MTIVLGFTPSPHLVLIGERLHLFCLYDGVPEPSAVWLLNGSVINTTDPEAGITVTSNATYSDLTVENTTDADGGSYSCNVSNSVGSDQASISVDIVFSTSFFVDITVHKHIIIPMLTSLYLLQHNHLL